MKVKNREKGWGERKSLKKQKLHPAFGGTAAVQHLPASPSLQGRLFARPASRAGLPQIRRRASLFRPFPHSQKQFLVPAPISGHGPAAIAAPDAGQHHIAAPDHERRVSRVPQASRGPQLDPVPAVDIRGGSLLLAMGAHRGEPTACCGSRPERKAADERRLPPRSTPSAIQPPPMQAFALLAFICLAALRATQARNAELWEQLARAGTVHRKGACRVHRCAPVHRLTPIGVFTPPCRAADTARENVARNLREKEAIADQMTVASKRERDSLGQVRAVLRESGDPLGQVRPGGVLTHVARGV